MEKIVKYNSFDDDIKCGDIIVFLDGSRKTIKNIKEGHRVIFDDGSKIDLFVVEIEGIIKQERSEIYKETVSSRVNSYDTLRLDDDEIYDESTKNKELLNPSTFSKKSSNYLTYQELFHLMESADKSGLGFSKYFWHFSTLSNIVEIIKAGKFKSRYDIEGRIPYDNKVHNSISRDVMFKNASWKTKTHVRFYLRPLNKPYFSMFKNLPDEEQKLYSICCVKKEALYASFKSTFLYYQNARAATDDVYNKSNELNQHQKNRFFVNNLEKFNFAETYSLYSENQSEQRSLYQEAEFMVWKELSFNFVDKIYFRTIEGLKTFLDKIKNHKEYNEIRKKCLVSKTYFGY